MTSLAAVPTEAPVQVSTRNLDSIMEGVLEGRAVTREDAIRLISGPDYEVDALCRTAAELRDRGRGKTVTYSPKVFIPLTRLCRDVCSYCTFRQEPHAIAAYLTPEEVIEVARAGERMGCWEALFTLGERPEQRYPEARAWLDRYGYKSTLDYLGAMCALVLKETRMLPHANPGTMARREMAALRPVNVSMGLMLESVSEKLYAPGGPHEHAPSKRPRVRLRTLDLAGQLSIPFTTGLLIGIGETLEEQVDGLLAIRDLHQQYGHIQEVIIQNFRAKPETPMQDAAEPTVLNVLRSVAVARIVLGQDMNLQVPPNLTASDYPEYLDAGINDWGGISPVTIDYVNPEAPWPQIADLRRNTEERGYALEPRLPLYREYVTQGLDQFVDPALHDRVIASANEHGLAVGGPA
ncbi:MAG: FO synthase [Chloroflexi bacterium]|jgi:FO synthase|nr:MAG: FO synthase [Chloroflexota bacterium]